MKRNGLESLRKSKRRHMSLRWLRRLKRRELHSCQRTLPMAGKSKRSLRLLTFLKARICDRAESLLILKRCPPMSDAWNNPFSSRRESGESVREKNIGKPELKTKKSSSSLSGRMFKAARSSTSLHRVSEEDAAKKEKEEHKLGGSRSLGNVRARMTKSAKSFSHLRRELKGQ
ncbi:hypothetical protein B0O99DRAFT_633575 [Bisporella sp. PMI_857]|nr:hypothetical protein B0O99DRAFT_633575 [Bisporella sp. PMI_857]